MAQLRQEQWAIIKPAIARLRASIMAVVLGIIGGTTLWLATVWLVVKGGQVVGPHLSLLGNYFPGYTVSWPGAFVGFVYGALSGGFIGYSVAFIYNKVALRRSSDQG
jgi:hypothetical protein